MSVSMAPTPALKGQAAKNVLQMINNPISKKELFKKCKELGSVFKGKQDLPLNRL